MLQLASRISLRLVQICSLLQHELTGFLRMLCVSNLLPGVLQLARISTNFGTRRTHRFSMTLQMPGVDFATWHTTTGRNSVLEFGTGRAYRFSMSLQVVLQMSRVDFCYLALACCNWQAFCR